MKNEYIPKEDLKPGQRYLIEIRDCCVEADLKGKLISKEDGEYGSLTFDIGKFDYTNGVNFYECDDG